MHNTIKNLIYIEELNKSKVNHDKLAKNYSCIKNFSNENILPLIDHGHLHYGENKVQEALDKWTDIKNKNHNIKLHLIGNFKLIKLNIALKIFDYIHSLDSEKLANKISDEQKKQKKNQRYLFKLILEMKIKNLE